MYPSGEPGWQLDLKQKENSRKALSWREFYAYRLMWRGGNDFNLLLRASKLTQQYIVDMYAKIEQQRLSYLYHNQIQLRADLYNGMLDVNEQGDIEFQSVGKKIILPPSFHGGPR